MTYSFLAKFGEKEQIFAKSLRDAEDKRQYNFFLCLSASLRENQSKGENIPEEIEMAKVSEVIVRALKEAGVTHVFGIPSIHNIGLYDALREEPSIRHILCRHESSATHMADGYARAGKGVGAIISSTGPGAGYMIAPLIEAWWSSSPVLAMTSNIATRKIGAGTGTLHELDEQDRMFAHITKERFCLRDADDAESTVRRAVATALAKRSGPVYLEVPADLWDLDAVTKGDIENDTGGDAVKGDCDEALSLLRQAKRPLIVAGAGAVRAGIGSAITKIAEALQAPVVTGAEGKGSIAEDHPLAFGNAARRGVVREMVRSCDVALALGTRLRNVDYTRRGVTLPQLIHVDWDDTWIGKNFPATIQLTGDIGEIARRLSEGLSSAGGTAERERGWVEALKKKAGEELEAIRAERKELAYLDAIRRVIPRDGHLVIDNTMLGYWAEYFYPSYEPGSFVTAKGSSIIGFSFPAAIGHALACPDRPVVAISGDGGFFYGAHELATCMRHGIGFPLIVVNDGAFGVIDFLQRLNYDRGYETKLDNPDLCAFAGSFGIKAVRVDSPESLEAALQRALESKEMRLIELVERFPESPFVKY